MRGRRSDPSLDNFTNYMVKKTLDFGRERAVSGNAVRVTWLDQIEVRCGLAGLRSESFAS